MIVKLSTIVSDYKSPALDIFYESSQEAFNLGRIMQEIINTNKHGVIITNGIRIPLIDIDSEV